MSVDKLQEKIRKCKNPSVLELNLTQDALPPHLLMEEGGFFGAYTRYCAELLPALKGLVPALRFSFSHFALLDQIPLLMQTLASAAEQGYYTIVDAPEALSAQAANYTAQQMCSLPCDAILTSAYLGSDIVKAYTKELKTSGKALFAVTRTANKSAAELQDLMTGSRLVHMAAADMVNHLAAPLQGRCGYSNVGLLAGASSTSSIRALRSKYPGLFLLLDGYDYPNANAKNCSLAFDKLGHGAAACASTSVNTAWQEAGTGEDYVAHAVSAAERMQKNLTRYITVL